MQNENQCHRKLVKLITLSTALSNSINYEPLHVQFSSVTEFCPTFFNPKDCSTPGSLFITNSWNLFKVMYIEVVMPSNHLILCCPLLLKPSIFPSTRVFFQ